jgi:hypothetical protein
MTSRRSSIAILALAAWALATSLSSFPLADADTKVKTHHGHHLRRPFRGHRTPADAQPPLPGQARGRAGQGQAHGAAAELRDLERVVDRLESKRKER